MWSTPCCFVHQKIQRKPLKRYEINYDIQKCCGVPDIGDDSQSHQNHQKSWILDLVKDPDPNPGSGSRIAKSRNREIAKKSYVSSGHRTPFQGSGSRITKSRNREMTGDYEPYFLLILLTKMTSHSEGKLDTKPSPMHFSCFLWIHMVGYKVYLYDFLCCTVIT